ncbi:YheC/YheD family protein [Bacillus sp. EB600]|uniref:YheC/YheD family endospore coat-associated protein n=1 Tax=Bacillus sp. EB600 TaxID=2806345 RepID=UPI00210DB6BC|nr:YheC/YheD family protein [Bacillus sp. EB600]
MKIFYDRVASKWYQTSVKTAVTFGGDKLPLPYYKALLNNDLSFSLQLEKGHAGPVIGIMTARKADGTITGNSALFIKIQKSILLHGGLSYIFTPEDVMDDYINGYILLPNHNHWKKIKAPFPDLVYNRIPFRKVEQEDRCQAFFSILKLKNIPFFNPCFIDKFDLYCLLQNHATLLNYLPKTELAANRQTLFSFLEKHKCVYLKPSHSAQGKGIFRLAYTDSLTLSLEGLKRKKIYPSFSDFWNDWETELIQKQYLVQEEVDSARYEGKKFDFRILAHAKADGYMVTGVGIRQAQGQNITTHVPNGGKLLPYDMFHSDELDQFITFAVNQIGEALTENYGFFGEFSIDAGISMSGDYYLYEVNSKPMSFDEIEIEGKKIEQLCRLFFQLTNFSFIHENSNSAE